PMLRPVLVGVAAAALVAAGCAAALATRSEQRSAPVASPADRTVTSTSDRTSTPAPVRFVTAAQVLDSAATYSLTTATPPAGQYRYVRSHALGVLATRGERAINVFINSIDENWISPSSTGVSYEHLQTNLNPRYVHPGDNAYLNQNAPGGAPQPASYWFVNTADGHSKQVYPPASPTSCDGCDNLSVWVDPQPAGLARLPREVGALRAVLYNYATGQLSGGSYGKRLTVDDVAFGAASTVLSSPLLPDDLRAALYRVTKTIPGITLKGSLANFDGTRGIAISRTSSAGVERDLIFDTAGGGYIGERTIALKSDNEYGLPAGTVQDYTAVTTSVAAKPVLPPKASSR
ncbi:MAG: CU044_5270 family protein, partial [Actinomycetota bacterium]|nr:CU044_5270 family protein [Actinomycetota bacterium]